MGAVLRFRRPTHSSLLSRRKLASNCARPAAALRDVRARAVQQLAASYLGIADFPSDVFAFVFGSFFANTAVALFGSAFFLGSGPYSAWTFPSSTS